MSDSQGLSAAKRAALERLLRGEGVLHERDTIRPRTADAIVPISAEQEHVWLHAAMAPDVPLYNEAITIHRHGACNPELLEASFNELLRRHEIWRTDFQMSDDGIVQRIHADLRLRLELTDLSALPAEEGEAEALEIAAEDARLPFDLSQAPLIRGKIVKLSDTEHRLYLTLHHIIFDGVSIYKVMMPTLSAIYARMEAGLAAEPIPAGLQYGDYAIWRAEQLAGDAIKRQLDYWSTTLAGELPSINLPYDRMPPAMPTHRGSMETFALSANLTKHLKRVSAELGVTSYTVLLAAFQVLLYRYSGNTDLVVGGVVDTRRRQALEPLMGYFLNSLPIRTRPAAGMSFRSYVHQTSNAVVGMLDACDVPFSRLVSTLQPRRNAATHPLFQVLFSIEPPAPQFAEGWDLTQMDVTIGAAKFDLYLELDERPDGMVGRFLYSTDLFEPATIIRMIDHWRTILGAAIAYPDCALDRLELLTPAETAQLAAWNDTVAVVPETPLHALFQTQARLTPNSVAIVFEGRAWTYAELDREADRIALWLGRSGVVPGMLVAVCLERSAELLAALLGILKAGAAYMPLDPAQPTERLTHCLERATATILLTRTHLLANFDPPDARVLLLDEATDPGEAEHLPECPDPDALAYVLCTSGTTGRPKAVEITHRSLVNLLTAMRNEPGFRRGDSLLAVTTVSFDISALELFLPLICGGRVVLAGRETAGDPFRLAELIHESRPAMMQATPSTWRALIDAGWNGEPGLKLLVGGESLPRELADELLCRAKSVWNMYGPTETTIWSTIQRVQEGRDTVPIGRPIANTTVFVVDPQGNQLPIGVGGELFIGGTGVAQGYRNQLALTDQRFTMLVAAPGERVYGTGDIVRLRTDGALVWLGRNDDQLKIRGFRVEPSEIEATLNAMPGVLNVAVVARADTSGSLQLVAHVVAPGLDSAKLRAAVARRLPHYMMPGRFMFHDALPLTPNGKLDRKQLPDPVQPIDVTARPATETERRLAELWKAVLELDDVGTDADFFAVGGHSLLAMRLLISVEKEFCTRISPVALFLSPTIESFAVVIDKSVADRPVAELHRLPVERNSSEPDRPRQDLDIRSAIKLRLVRAARGVSRGIVLGMPGMEGHAAGIGVIAANALYDYDVWAFAIDTNGRRLVEFDGWTECARVIADRLLAEGEIRPRALIGFSLGGYLAWLVDRYLVAAGRAASAVINFDGGAPHAYDDNLAKLVDPALPSFSDLGASRMLLLHRRAPGTFLLPTRSEAEWDTAGVPTVRLSYRTLNHLDLILPVAIAASRDALATFIETGEIGPAPLFEDPDFDTEGGLLFRMVDDPAPPAPETVRRVVEGVALPYAICNAVVLLFLAAASGDVETTLDLSKRLAATEPWNREAVYTQVALLSQIGRQKDASFLAEAWQRNYPLDSDMASRARWLPQRRMEWHSAESLVIGSTPSLDFATSFARIDVKERSVDTAAA